MLSYKISSVILSVLFIASLGLCQDYLGSQMCANCHGSRYNTWSNTGHHYILNAVSGDTALTYPFEFNTGTPNIENLPLVNGFQLEWSDVSYTIGGYYWKAQFIDPDGYIYTGGESDETQWNIQTQTWAAYYPGEVNNSYNCGGYHTTGYNEEGNQGGLPGLTGTWAEDGVGCERCHGTGSGHPFGTSNIHIDESSELCGECHSRDSEHRIVVSDGFILNHEQYDEHIHSPHSDELTCVSCHNTHKSTVYAQGGIRTACTSCHDDYVIPGKEDFSCESCHMPKTGVSAEVFNDNKGDISSHQYKIWVTTFPKDSMFYSDSSGMYVKTDESGQVLGNTLDFACLSCHTGWTIEGVYEYARNIHTEGLNVETGGRDRSPENYVLLQNYPNPFNQSTVISYKLQAVEEMSLTVYDITGREIQSLVIGYQSSGEHSVVWDAEGISSGIYVVRLKTSSSEVLKKMVLLK